MCSQGVKQYESIPYSPTLEVFGYSIDFGGHFEYIIQFCPIRLIKKTKYD